MVERLMIMCSSDTIKVEDLPPNIHSPTQPVALKMDSGMTLKELRESVEREYILQALKNNKWNVSQAAKDLDIDRTNLHKKINYYKLGNT